MLIDRYVLPRMAVYVHELSSTSDTEPSRTLSVTFGRPGTVPNRYLRLERPKHIDAWTSRHNPECEPTLSLDFYNATM